MEIGTTYSGFAFATRKDILKSIDEHTGKIAADTDTWNFGSSMKKMIYTSVLFRPDQTFHSFGFEAEKFYYNNPKDVDLKQWFFFKRFKPLLNEQVK